MYDAVNLFLGLGCNYSCANCCSGSGPDQPFDDAQQIIADGASIGPVEEVVLTGGEATAHPDWHWIASRVRDAYRAKTVTLATNGSLLHKLCSTAPALDWVRITAHPREDGKQRVIQIPSGLSRTRITVSMPGLLEGPRPGHDRPCERFRARHAGYRAGYLYPCCVAPALPDAPRVAVSRTWRAELADIGADRMRNTCARCPFARPAGVSD